MQTCPVFLNASPVRLILTAVKRSSMSVRSRWTWSIGLDELYGGVDCWTGERFQSPGGWELGLYSSTVALNSGMLRHKRTSLMTSVAIWLGRQVKFVLCTEKWGQTTFPGAHWKLVSTDIVAYFCGLSTAQLVTQMDRESWPCSRSSLDAVFTQNSLHESSVPRRSEWIKAYISTL